MAQDFRHEFRPGPRDRRFSWRGRDYAAIRAPAFRYPPGWGARTWRRGDILPSLLLAAPFFFERFSGLPASGPGTRWVRYGPDALLVDIRTGRVIDVIYGAFFV